jgi:hypothetical protein
MSDDYYWSEIEVTDPLIEELTITNSRSMNIVNDDEKSYLLIKYLKNERYYIYLVVYIFITNIITYNTII